MATATIQFGCPQCGKKYTTPATFAGKSVSCGCGTKISVPSAQAAAAGSTSTTGSQSQVQQPFQPTQVSYQPQPSTPLVSTGAPGTSSGASSGNSGGGSDGSRRDFPALTFVAKITDIISWIYIIGGLIAAVGVVVAGGAEAFPFSLFGGIAVALIVMLIAVFIRAMAEMIRLALYIAKLLEDVRSNTG